VGGGGGGSPATLIRTFKRLGPRPYNVFQLIIDNVANCKVVGAIIEDRYLNIF
jgi:hypothetical protein